MPKPSLLLIQVGSDGPKASPHGRSARESFGMLEWDPATGALSKMPAFTPLSIATVAGMTPADFDVDLWDENLDGSIADDTVLPREHYDLVGLSGMFNVVEPRLLALAELFRARKSYVVAGGPCVSGAPFRFRDGCDTIFINEAEATWPQFLADWRAGTPKPEYVQVDRPELDASPVPAWGRLAPRVKEYWSGTVQTTRGCPFDCEFCDVIYLYGRRQRHKPIATVLREVENLHALGCRWVFFTDDEFVGDPKYARELVAALAVLNARLARPLKFSTQLTITLAKHDELLDAMAKAGFAIVFIGIESLSEASLRGTKKLQNVRPDLIGDLHKILKTGIAVMGSFIVGFDQEGPEVFAPLTEGIGRSCLPMVTIGTLGAPVGTELWNRLREENRLVKLRRANDVAHSLRIDLMPGGMTRIELLEGWRTLARGVLSWGAICERLAGWAELVDRPLAHEHGPPPSPDVVARVAAELAARAKLDDVSRAAVDAMLARVAANAPAMMARVLTMLLRNEFVRRFRANFSDEQFDQAIALEREGDFVHDTTPIGVPRDFLPHYATLFPIAVEELYRGGVDKTALPAAASTVFVDFFVRWGAELGGRDDARWGGFVRELCHRTAARLAGAAPETWTLPAPDAVAPQAEIKRARLADAVLKEVIDRLRAQEARA